MSEITTQEEWDRGRAQYQEEWQARFDLPEVETKSYKFAQELFRCEEGLKLSVEHLISAMQSPGVDSNVHFHKVQVQIDRFKSTFDGARYLRVCAHLAKDGLYCSKDLHHDGYHMRYEGMGNTSWWYDNGEHISYDDYIKPNNPNL